MTRTNEESIPHQSRSWILTISADLYSRTEIEEALSPYTYIGQLERGEAGFVHWQVLIENEWPIRRTTLLARLPRVHIEPRRGSVEQAVAYVTKLASRVEDEPPLAQGDIQVKSEQGRRTDVERVRSAVLEEGLSFDEVLLWMPEAARMSRYVQELVAARDRSASRSEERDVKVTYLYGEPGLGKTRWAYDNCENLYRVTSYDHPFDGYSRESTLVLDEFAGQIDIRTMNTILDRYPMELPARYYNRPAMFNEVVIISNVAPWGLYGYEPARFRQAFARRLGTVLEMQTGGHVLAIDPDTVAARFMGWSQTSTAN